MTSTYRFQGCKIKKKSVQLSVFVKLVVSFERLRANYRMMRILILMADYLLLITENEDIDSLKSLDFFL